MSTLKKWFSHERTMRWLDRIVKNEIALPVGAALFAFVLWRGWWEWVEPLLTLVILPVAAATWYEHWRAKHRRYAPTAADRGRGVIVSVDVNTDTAESVRAHFGREADVYVRAETELGKKFLEPEDVSRLARLTARKCAPYRDRTIFLVLAGPAGLCFQIGQLLAAHKFDVVPLSWARNHYQELPRLGVDDIGAD
jgi:hypothetical protein